MVITPPLPAGVAPGIANMSIVLPALMPPMSTVWRRTGASSSTVNFEYQQNDAAVIESVTPSAGFVTGGTVVRVTLLRWPSRLAVASQHEVAAILRRGADNAGDAGAADLEAAVLITLQLAVAGIGAQAVATLF